MNDEPLHSKALDENLIGYLLQALDDETVRHVEAQLEADEGARWRLEQLRLALEPLAGDKEEIAPPAGLAVRAIGRVAEYCCLSLSQAPLAACRPSPPRSWWRRADLVVAAAVLLLATGLGMPALFRARVGASVVECENNLRVLGNALNDYQTIHHEFPSVAGQRPRDAAGMVVPILASAGVLKDAGNVHCPGNGPAKPIAMTLKQAHALSDEDFVRQAANLFPSYAYSLGYRDDEEHYFGPAVPPGEQASDFPMMADAPPPDGGLGNSANHGGLGQVILFADGHIRFVTIRTIGFQKDDIYRNKDNKVAAGLDPCDTVLGPSAAKP
jgi:hypothetical protein